MRLLLAEDEKELSNALCAIFRHHNYSVDAVYDGASALDYGLSQNYDAIILDIMMPRMDGLEVLARLRRSHVFTPVLLLTAKGEVSDRIRGLDAGADDYLPKPFDMGELLARVRSITRRKEEFLPNVLQVGNTTLDRTDCTLSVHDRRLRLGSKEFQMLELLMEHPRQLISTEQFMERIWGYDAEAEINVVWVYISYLRNKLSTLQSNVSIKVTRGIGYSLETGDTP